MQSGPRVAVLGVGTVGATLVRSLDRAGVAVTIGARNPDADHVGEVVAECGGRVDALTPADAVTASDVVILTVPGAAAAPVLADLAGLLDTKVVIDATNDLSGDHAPGTLSALGALSEVAPTARGYRAFNSIGLENMANPHFGGIDADLFFAGPDGDGRESVEAVISALGFRPVYVGGAPSALASVDALATLWFALAFGQGRGRSIAFKLLERPPAT